MIVGHLHSLVSQAYRKVFNENPPKFEIGRARLSIFGDFSSNLALVAASDHDMSPLFMAQKLVSVLEESGVFKNVSVSSPGFINFTVTDEHLLDVINQIIKNPDKFGRSDLGNEIRVLVEYVSANPTGPLTLANGRGAFVGETISRVLELYGCTVMREYYVNDRGGQIDSLGHSVLKDDKAEYNGKYIDELAKRNKKTDPRVVGEEAAAYMLEKSIKPVLRTLGIDFHQFFSEKSLYKTGVAKRILELLKEKGLTYESDGALFLNTTRYGDDKDRVLVKSDKEETYFLSDIAYHAYKIQRGYHRLINVVGADHYTYTKQLQMIVDAVLRDQFTWAGQLDWVITQIVRLIEDGKEVKMSKRAGTYVPLDELLEDLSADIVRFFFISKSVDTHLDFDMDLAKSSSTQNPVYYIQYAYARISSIFRQFSREDDFEMPEKIMITHPVERQLLLRLLQFPDLIEEIAGDLQVHKLPSYVTALATDLHSFYEKLRVKGETPEIANSRLAILKATSLTMKKALDLMGISAPSRMVR